MHDPCTLCTIRRWSQISDGNTGADAKAPARGPTPGRWPVDLHPITKLESGVTQPAPRSTGHLAIGDMQ